MQKLHWTEAINLPGKRGNKWIVTPTKQMLLGGKVTKISQWSINREITTVEVTYDYDYAVAWTRHRLGVLNEIPNDVRFQFLNAVFPVGDTVAPQKSTTSKARQKPSTAVKESKD